MEQICSSVFEIHHSRCKQGMHDLVSYVQKRLEAEQEGTEEKLIFLRFPGYCAAHLSQRNMLHCSQLTSVSHWRKEKVSEVFLKLFRGTKPI